jgi:hypothetical protein
LLVAFQIRNCENSVHISQIKESVDSMPMDPDGIYDRTWTSIKSQIPNDSSLATRVLLWVCSAKRNLSITELKEAIAVENKTREIDAERFVPIIY